MKTLNKVDEFWDISMFLKVNGYQFGKNINGDLVIDLGTDENGVGIVKVLPVDFMAVVNYIAERNKKGV